MVTKSHDSKFEILGSIRNFSYIFNFHSRKCGSSWIHRTCLWYKTHLGSGTKEAFYKLGCKTSNNRDWDYCVINLLLEIFPTQGDSYLIRNWPMRRKSVMPVLRAICNKKLLVGVWHFHLHDIPLNTGCWKITPTCMYALPRSNGKCFCHVDYVHHHMGVHTW